jgi:predicted transcriptional regulator with HTH domain
MISLRSEITKKLLNYFFLNPKESLYVNELSRNLALDKRNLVKKIKELGDYE